jgi:PAS domain S-box-containing protein
VTNRGQLDVVLRELEDVNALLADAGATGDGALAAARERLLGCVRVLEDVEADARDERDELTVALETERRRYEELFQFAPVAYLLTGVSGVIEEANGAAGELLGVVPRWLLGKPLAVFVDLADRRPFRDLLAAVRRGGVGLERELRFRGRAGTFIGSAAVVHVGESDASSLRWVIRDVTARRRAEDQAHRLAEQLEQRVDARTRELERERALLDAVIQQMPAGVTITDAASGQLLIANAEAWEIARERFEAGEGLEPLLRTLGNGSETAMQILETLGLDGEQGAIEVTSAPLHDGDGAVTSRVTVFRDVTARERLERAEREFVTNAAHELQTPLTAITSAAEVLQAGAKEDPGDRDRFLTHIQRECDRLARLVRALLVLARAQSGGQTAEAELLVLRPLLADVAASLRPAGGVEIGVRCQPRLTVRTNRDLLEQALASLAANAAKYTTAGSIRLEARRAGRDRIVVEVVDTGPGIAPAERELVRQRFYRGGRRDRTGFGLGLAIAEQAAQALGGTLELEPGHEGGTLARLVVPSGSGR